MDKIIVTDNADSLFNGGKATEEVLPIDAYDSVAYLILKTSSIAPI